MDEGHGLEGGDVDWLQKYWKLIGEFFGSCNWLKLRAYSTKYIGRFANIYTSTCLGLACLAALRPVFINVRKKIIFNI